MLSWLVRYATYLNLLYIKNELMNQPESNVSDINSENVERNIKILGWTRSKIELSHANLVSLQENKNDNSDYFKKFLWAM